MKKLFITLAVAAAALTSCTNTCQNTECQEVRNVILMIGDGMGLAQTSMVMIENGYEPSVIDRAENIALMKTYSSNNRVTDSAAAGTAIACGVKTNNATLGLTPQLDTINSIAVAAKSAGMSTGVVVTSALQHATPAAFYAHVEKRYNYQQISEQFLTSQMDVAIGGGAKYFNQMEVDGRKMIDIAKDKGYNIARNFEELSSIEEGKVLGLFEQDRFKKMIEGRDSSYLQNATADALSRLSKNEKGFFLMVEGSLIDYTCHDSSAEATLVEVADFERSVKVAMDFADANPGTLVIVTADHETGGLSMVSGDADFTKAESGLDYKFSTHGHSGIMVPIYTYGTGAEDINGVMENTELSDKILDILSLKR